jgi:hypothetical protein
MGSRSIGKVKRAGWGKKEYGGVLFGFQKIDDWI